MWQPGKRKKETTESEERKAEVDAESAKHLFAAKIAQKYRNTKNTKKSRKKANVLK